MRDIHSFNICPKASHGAQIQCYNKQRRIGLHYNIQEEQTSFEEGQSAKPGPGSQIGAVCPSKTEMRDIHSFNICPKASHGAQYNVTTSREELDCTITYRR